MNSLSRWTSARSKSVVHRQHCHRSVFKGHHPHHRRDRRAAGGRMGWPVHQFLDHGVLCRLLHALQPDARQGRPRRPGQSGEDRGNLASGLCCVEQNQGGHDLSSLSRRFRSLVGLSADHDSIKSGIGRMGLRLQPLNERTIRENNEKTLEREKPASSEGSMEPGRRRP